MTSAKRHLFIAITFSLLHFLATAFVFLHFVGHAVDIDGHLPRLAAWQNHTLTAAFYFLFLPFGFVPLIGPFINSPALGYIIYQVLEWRTEKRLMKTSTKLEP